MYLKAKRKTLRNEKNKKKKERKTLKGKKSIAFHLWYIFELDCFFEFLLTSFFVSQTFFFRSQTHSKSSNTNFLLKVSKTDLEISLKLIFCFAHDYICFFIFFHWVIHFELNKIWPFLFFIFKKKKKFIFKKKKKKFIFSFSFSRK